MPEPHDEVILLRAIWRDRDYDEGQLLAGNVFPMEDIRKRYISVDRHDLFDEREAFGRLKGQQQRSIEKGDTSRRVPEVGFLPCWEVRNLRVDENSEPYFAVSDASVGFYPSHCAITNVNTTPGRPSHSAMRLSLMDILHQYGVALMFP